MKRIAFACRFQPDVDFTFPEQALLSEESYELDDKGKVRTKAARIILAGNIKFAFRTYAQAHLAKYKVKDDGSGWDAFKKTIKIRDRLMHPKRASDLVVSNDEMSDLLETYIWFENSVKEVQQVSLKAMEDSFKPKS